MKNIIIYKYLITIILCIINNNSILSGQSLDSTAYPEIRVQGYVKSLQGLLYERASGKYSSVNILHNRFNVPATFSKSISARLDVRNRLIFGDQIINIPGFSEIIEQYNGIRGLSWVWLDRPGFVGHTVVDRLWLSWQKGAVSVTLGRQRINWGITNFWTLNDVFNTYNFLDFDYEERPGSDAAKLSWQIQSNHAVTLAVQPGVNNIRKVYAAMYKGNIRNYDIQCIVGNWHDYFLLAGGWAGSIGNTGFKGEWNYFLPTSPSVDSISSFSGTIMADRTFAGDWYVHSSVLYSSNPGQESLTSAGFAGPTISAKNIFPFNWTFSAGCSKSLAVLYALSLNVIYAPEDRTTILLPGISRDMGNNVDVDLTAQIFLSAAGHTYKEQAYATYLRGKWSF
jgi:hypothetical protein